SANYLLFKNGITDKGIIKGSSPEWDKFILFVRLFNTALQKNPTSLPAAFSPIKTIHIPADNSRLLIYKKERAITPEEWKKFGEALSNVDPDNAIEIENAEEQYIGKN